MQQVSQASLAFLVSIFLQFFTNLVAQRMSFDSVSPNYANHITNIGSAIHNASAMIVKANFALNGGTANDSTVNRLIRALFGDCYLVQPYGPNADQHSPGVNASRGKAETLRSARTTKIMFS